MSRLTVGLSDLFNGVSRGARSAQPALVPDSSQPLHRDPLDTFAGVAVNGLLGEGCRCTVFAARSGSRELVLKAYHAQAAARHAQRWGVSIARYEYQRNAAFRNVPGLAAHVAAPIAFVSTPQTELFLQEHVSGLPLTTFLDDCSGQGRDTLLGRLRYILARAHAAQLFDLDLHPSNVLVKRAPDGTAWPMLFDFNKVPYHVRPPNALCALLVRLGIIGCRTRDYRQWKRLCRIAQVRGGGSLPRISVKNSSSSLSANISC